MTCGDTEGLKRIAGFEGGELIFFKATGDFEKAIEYDNFAFGFEEMFGFGGVFDLDDGFFGLSVGHLSGEGAVLPATSCSMWVGRMAS